MKDITETILESIDNVVSARITDLKYDKTDLCQIEKVLNEETGEYLVSNSQMRYSAFSSEKYFPGNSVYVLIPQSDYNNQKIILRKYNKNDNLDNWVNPMDSYVDLTDNIIQKQPNADGFIFNEAITNNIINGTDKIYTNYDRLGLRFEVQFDTKSPENVRAIEGNYGIRVHYTSTLQGKVESGTFELTNEDMLGTPYPYEASFPQEKVFRLNKNATYSINQIEIFHNKDFLGYDETGQQGLVPTNGVFFIKNLYLSLGQDLGNFKTDTVILTSDNNKYNIDNRKVILNAKWIHFVEGKPVSISNLNHESIRKDFNKIHWYRYDITSPSNQNEFYSDPLAGDYWREFESFSSDFIAPIDDLHHDWEKEIFKVIIEHNDKRYESKMLTIKNESTNNMDNILPWIKGLKIVYPQDDKYKGIFYFEDGIVEANDHSYAKTSHSLIAQYDILHNEFGSWSGNETIIWRIPVGASTMIAEPVEEDIVNAKILNADETIEFNGSKFNGQAGYKTIIRKIDETDESKQQKYRIKNNYDDAAKNNTIYCEVWRGGVQFMTSVTFEFGIAGNNGTPYTLIINWDGQVDGITEEKPLAFINNKVNTYTFSYKVLDADRTLAIDNIVENLKLFWYYNNTAINTNNVVTLDLAGKAFNAETANQCPILCEVTFAGKKLTKVIPFGLRTTADSKYINGAKALQYDANGGNPEFVKTPYSLNGEETAKVTLINGDAQLLSLAEEKTLVPAKNYLWDKEPQYVVNLNDNWLQPLIILLNPYGSKKLNQWDGGLKIDDKGNEVYTAALVAGTKNANNQFSGIIAGKVSQIDNKHTSNHGILGYNNGLRTFTLDANKGSATFGGAGAGRIEINGSEGYIVSENFNGFNNGPIPPKDNDKPVFGEGIIPKGTYIGLKTGNACFAGTITTQAGYIGGWIIGNNEISKGKVYLSSVGGVGKINDHEDKWNIYSNDNFGVTTTGKLYATEANIDGTIYARRGEIGGCNIQNGILQIKQVNISEKINADVIDADTLKVNAANITGTLTASQINTSGLSVDAANITGTLTASQIDATDLHVNAANVDGELIADDIYYYDGPMKRNVRDDLIEIYRLMHNLDERIIVLEKKAGIKIVSLFKNI